MLRIFFGSLGIVAVVAAGSAFAADSKLSDLKRGDVVRITEDNGKVSKIDEENVATITKVDPKEGTVTVQMPDENGKPVTRVFHLTGNSDAWQMKNHRSPSPRPTARYGWRGAAAKLVSDSPNFHWRLFPTLASHSTTLPSLPADKSWPLGRKVSRIEFACHRSGFKWDERPRLDELDP